MNEVIIGIGSNLDAANNVLRVMEILAEKFELLKVSEFVKTKPIGITEQPDFTNGAAKIRTYLNRDNLENKLKQIEDQMGRDRSAPKFGPRCIDLDIIVWNGEIVDDDYYTRDFLQRSVQEII